MFRPSLGPWTGKLILCTTYCGRAAGLVSLSLMAGLNPWSRVEDSQLRELILDCAKFKLLSAVTRKIFASNFPTDRINPYSADVFWEHDGHLQELAASHLARRSMQRSDIGESFEVDKTLELAGLIPGEFNDRIGVAAGHVVGALAIYAIIEVGLSGINVGRAERIMVIDELAGQARKFGVGVPGYMSNPEEPLLQSEPLLRRVSLTASKDLAALYEALLPRPAGLGLD